MLSNAHWMFDNNVQQTLNMNVQETLHNARIIFIECLKICSMNIEYKCSVNVSGCLWMINESLKQTFIEH